MRNLTKFLIFTFLISSVARALEIDEKLTLRFLKVSNSKKTILINRGAEDGLAIGDHAKFFITAGVIARGVVEKVSPSRSIWSLYRVVDNREITDGKVLNLKIASPVKITDDPSKSMKEEEIPGGSDKMSMSDGDSTESADKAAGTTLDEADKKELEGMGLEDTEKPVKKDSEKKSKKKEAPKTSEVTVDEAPIYSSNTSKNWEVWGTLYVNSLSGTVSSDTSTNGSTAATASTIDLSAGIEHYFLTSDGFFRNVSLLGFIHKRTVESGQDIKDTSDWFEFGGGVNYHFYNSAASVNKLIGYGSLCGGFGKATLKDTVVSSGTSTETSVKGSNKFISIGVGTKYILSNGFGVRAVLDYYSSSETYDFGLLGTSKRTLAGPRIQFGLSYRF